MENRRGPAVAILATLLSSGVACSSPEALSGQGGSCLMDTDCECPGQTTPGVSCYVCINGSCTSNLAPLVNIEAVGDASDAAEVPQEAAALDASLSEATLPELDATQPVIESSTPVVLAEASSISDSAAPVEAASTAEASALPEASSMVEASSVQDAPSLPSDAAASD